MNSRPFDRRRFNELSAAALGGLAAGSTVGCGDGAPKGSTPTKPVTSLGDKHTCRGLNECKGQGAGGKNECRGQGDCATVAKHDCGTENECKGQGGCGSDAGLNECKGKGGCHVPLMDSAWKSVRERLEKKWTADKATFAAAPAKKD